jgi:hypothetical protein
MTSILITQDHSLIVLSQNLMCFLHYRIKICRLKWKDFNVGWQMLPSTVVRNMSGKAELNILHVNMPFQSRGFLRRS